MLNFSKDTRLILFSVAIIAVFFSGQIHAQTDIELLKNAAEQGDVRAQIQLGLNFEIGKEVQQNYPEAIKWYKKAADQGEAPAQWLLGLMYYDGKGVPQNYSEALKLFLKAAKQGLAVAQSDVSKMYYTGTGVQQNNAEALRWALKAAEQGIPLSQFIVGYMYYRGEVVVQNYAEAIKWYTKAAEQGFAAAQINLGLMYKEGIGVTQNYFEAYAWFVLAATSGDKKARWNMESLAMKMPPEQISKAQKLAAEIQYRINQTSDLKKTSPSVSEEKVIRSSGTGFIITKDGYILTCQHVIDGAKSIKALINGNSYIVTLVAEDKSNDLALLKISGTFSALAFSSKNSAQLGQKVFTIGYPNPILQGVSKKYTDGTISSLTGYQDDVRLYQISVPVQPGNSGGPLLDENGNVVGIIVAMLDAEAAFNISRSLPQNVNYAVKSIYAKGLLSTRPELADKLPNGNKKLASAGIVDKVKECVAFIVTY